MMKLLLIALVLASCTAAKPIVLTVTSNSGKEVQARRGNEWWNAACTDTIKPGTVITALPYAGQPDCNCIFKRVK